MRAWLLPREKSRCTRPDPCTHKPLQSKPNRKFRVGTGWGLRSVSITPPQCSCYPDLARKLRSSMLWSRASLFRSTASNWTIARHPLPSSRNWKTVNRVPCQRKRTQISHQLWSHQSWEELLETTVWATLFAKAVWSRSAKKLCVSCKAPLRTLKPRL